MADKGSRQAGGRWGGDRRCLDRNGWYGPSGARCVSSGEHWQRSRRPSWVSTRQRLAAVAAALGGRGCIIKDGYVVHTWGSQSEDSDWFSSAKPVLSTLLMFAVQEGKVPSVDAPIACSAGSCARKTGR